MKNHCDINDLFTNETLVKVAAPMVRYSKLQFRTLVRKYGCDLCFSPMIIADSFIKSLKARESDFSTSNEDTPLSVQFAANNNEDFVTAAKYCDGVDLNCGCPQRWAMKEGYGADLLKKPQIIKDSVLQLRNSIPKPFAVSVKIRINPDIRLTVELCKSLEAAGITFITVHSRTPSQRCEPINLNALQDIKQSIKIPLIANGDIRSLDDALLMQELTGCNGVMAARGLLQNPALFSGYDKTPVACVEAWVKLAIESEMPFQCFHHHLVFMLEKILPKPERRIFNVLSSTPDVLDSLVNYFSIEVPVRNNLSRFRTDIIYKDETISESSYFLDKISKTTPQLPFEDYLSDSCYLFGE
ncbi:dihydrouridine synthase 4 isoform X2 [Lycorma delicatula]|uniref:dihydrouridine synthase 4 isoform X2 n=1 Tax=Lycorma delicatula TaxID=130591 RepID=UPI003F51A4CA